MSTKRKSTISPEGSGKKQRKVIDLEMKMKIINDYDAGKKVKAIARAVGLAHSTVSTILKHKERIREAVKTSSGFKAIITRQRKGLIHEMEKLLVIWFDDQIQKKMPMSLLIIRTKARIIFETLKQHEGSQCTETFTASHGWFQGFRRRFNLHNRHISGEAASSDKKAADSLIENVETFSASNGWFRGFHRRFNLHNRHISSEAVSDHKEVADKVVENVNSINKNIVELANALNLEVEDIENLVKYTDEQLTNKDLIRRSEAQKCFQDEEEKKKEVPNKFTVKGLASVFSKVNTIMLELESMDPNVERFTRVQCRMNETLQCYREIYEEKKKKITKQTKQTRNSQKSISPTSTPTIPTPIYS